MCANMLVCITDAVQQFAHCLWNVTFVYHSAVVAIVKVDTKAVQIIILNTSKKIFLGAVVVVINN